MNRGPRLGRPLILGLAGVCALSVLVLISWPHLEPGVRSYARGLLEEQLASLLSGEVHIDRLDKLHFGGLVAHGVSVLDPARRPVLRADLLELDVDLAALLRGRLRFTRGRLDQVRIRAIASKQAAITLFDALIPQGSSAPESASGLSVWFENLHITNAVLYGSVPGLDDLRAEGILVRGHIRIDDRFRADVTQVRASLVRPVNQPVELVHATTQVDTEPFEIRVAARLSERDDRVRASLTYRAPEGSSDHLALRLMLEPVSAELLSALNIAVGESLIADLQGSVRVFGPLDHLTFAAALRSDAGPITVRGDLPASGHTNVHVQTDELDLSRLLAYFPPIRLRASVDASAPPDGPVAITARAPWVDIMGVVVPQTEVVGRYARGRFDIDQAAAMYAGGHFTFHGWVDENADLRVRLQSRVGDIGRDPTLRGLGVSAALKTDAVLEKRGEVLSFDGSLGLTRFQYRGITLRDFQLSGSAVAEGDLTQPRVRLAGQARALRFEAYAADSFRFQVRGARGRYSSQFTLRDSAGRVLAGTVGVAQNGDRVQVVADPFALAVGGREAWRAQADLVFAPDGIDFRKIVLVNGPQRLDVAGHFSYSKAYRVDATLKSFDLGGLRELAGVDLADLDGTVDGKLALTGVPNHPRIDAQGRLRRGVFLGMTDLTVLLSMVFVEGRFDIDSELLLPDGSRVAVYAGGTPGPGDTWTDEIASGSYEFGLDFEHVPFAVSEPWLAWLGLTPPPGTLSASVRGAGTLDAPLLDIACDIQKLELTGLPPLDIGLAAAHDGASLTLHRLEIADPRGRIARAEGLLAATFGELLDLGTLRASLDQRALRLAVEWSDRRLDQLPEPVRLNLPLLSSGSFILEQSAQGPSAQLEARATWPGNEGVGACALVRRPWLRLAAAAIGNETRGTLEVSLDREKVVTGEVRAATPFSAWLTGAREFFLPQTNVQVRARTDTVEEIPILCEHMAGPIRAELTANDLFADPPDLAFYLESSALQLVPHGIQNSRLGNLQAARAAGRPFSVTLRGNLNGEQVTFSADVDQGHGGRLHASGSVARAALKRTGRPADVPKARAKLQLSQFELAPILLALPMSTRVSGLLDGTAQVTYDVTRDALGLQGALAFSRGKLVIGPLGQELSDVRANLRLQDNWIRLEQLEANDFEGQLRAQGDVVLESARRARADLWLRVADFPLRSEGAKVSSITGRMRLRAEVDAERTRSELQVLDLRVNLPVEMAQGTQDLGLHPDIVVAGEAPEPPPDDPYIFELRLLAKDPPFRVLRTGLSAGVRADLSVRYREPILTLQGSAELERGNFEMYGKRFELEQGRIAFDGGDQLDPLVNLYAVHRIGSDEIGVRVEGRLSDPSVSFTHSNPSITDTGQIVAALVGGRRADPNQRNQDASGAAAGFLAGATAGLLTEEVRREFGGVIPVLSIESQNRSMRSTRIRAGVQLDQFIEKRLGPLRHVLRGAYVEGFVAPGADPNAVGTARPPQSRGGGLLELRFPADLVGTVEYRPVQNWRLDVAWEP